MNELVHTHISEDNVDGKITDMALMIQYSFFICMTFWECIENAISV